MAYVDTYQPITVANSRPFNVGADENRPELMGGPVIEMTAKNGRSLASLLEDFNMPAAPPARPMGASLREIELEANNWGAAFGEMVDATHKAAANYWGTPVAKAPAVAQAPAPTALDRIGGLADGLANSFTGSTPVASVETAALQTSQRGLSGNFGQLSQGEPSAFERRYQGQAGPRKPGNDYV